MLETVIIVVVVAVVVLAAGVVGYDWYCGPKHQP